MEKLEIGKEYKIGEYNCEVGTTGSKKFYLANSREENSLIYSQFNIERSEIESITGNKHEWGFPECNTLEDLQRVYEYIMSKDPANKNKTVNVRDIKYPDQIHITSKDQWEKIVKYYSKIHPYIPKNKYYLADRSGSKETPFTGYPASVAGQDSYNTYEFEDVIFPEEKQPEEQLSSLPKRWCIKAYTPEQEKEINAYARSLSGGGHWTDSINHARTYFLCVSDGKYIRGNDSFDDDYTKITYEQFKKWVIKEETQSDVKEWEVNTYVVFVKEGYLGSGYCLDTLPKSQIGKVGKITHKYQDSTTACEGYSYVFEKDLVKWFATKEEAEKFSLSLSSSKTIEKPNIQTMEQFKIGDWVYSECLNTGSSKGIGKITKIDKEDSRQPCLMLNIKGRGEVWSYNGYQRLATKDEIPSDTTNSSLKVNDWVVVTERYDCNYAEVGMIGQLTKTDLRHSIPYEVGNCKDFSGRSWCKNVRKAEPWEISNTIRITQEKIINSSTNVALATKGQLPLYEVKKRVVLN